MAHMTLEEALKAKTVTEAEFAVISKNLHLVSEKDKKRLGLSDVVDQLDVEALKKVDTEAEAKAQAKEEEKKKAEAKAAKKDK